LSNILFSFIDFAAVVSVVGPFYLAGKSLHATDTTDTLTVLTILVESRFSRKLAQILRKFSPKKLLLNPAS